MGAFEEWSAIDVLALVHFTMQRVVPGVALVILLSGIDDLLIDILFGIRWLWRRLTIYRYRTPMTAADLPAPVAQLPIAVMIPAWREAEVIGSMLHHALTTWSEEVHLRLFVGWYCNDLDTGREIARVAAQDPRVIPVVVPHPGPTTKADCLNVIWTAIHAWEADHCYSFEIFLLHDAEDQVAAAEPVLVRHLIAECGKAMVQTPVIPVPVPGSIFISGHYLDEFAEAHGKDMMVREAMGAWLPSAGVGSAFVRAALLYAASERHGQPFAAGSVTEDYELSMRLGQASFTAAFVHMPIKFDAGPVATAEHFPDRLDAAVRQKARWLMGITLQGWQTLGWHGTFAQRYWLLRDRKALLVCYINMLGYMVALFLVPIWWWQLLNPLAPHFPDLIGIDSGTALILHLNGGLVSWRLMMRALCVWHIAGLPQALLSIPRTVVSNIVNFLAAVRAVRLYTKAMRKGQAIAWEKTSHRFPVLVQP